jgi:hypothetical protein
MAIYYAIADLNRKPNRAIPGNSYSSAEWAWKAARALLGNHEALIRYGIGAVDRLLIVKVTTQEQGYAYRDPL